MAWRIEFERAAERELERLPLQVTRRVLRFLRERIAPLEDPRLVGEALKGDRLGGLWKYRVGDYRIVAAIEDHLLRIVVVRVGDRKDVYRR